MSLHVSRQPCPLCVLQVRLAEWMLLTAFQVLAAPYVEAQCQCPGQPHRLLVQHPHVPKACEGFTILPCQET